MPIVCIHCESVKPSESSATTSTDRFELYRTRYEQRIQELSPRDAPCIHCLHPLTHGHGYYPRKPYTFEGFREEWDIHRRYCPVCKHTFGLLPSHLAPYARYTIDVQDAATSSVGAGRSYEQTSSQLSERGVTVEVPTLRNWFRRFQNQVREILPFLSSLVQQEQPQRQLPPLRSGVRDAHICGYYDRLPLLGSLPHSGTWNLRRQIVCLFAPPVSVNRVSYGLSVANTS